MLTIIFIFGFILNKLEAIEFAEPSIYTLLDGETYYLRAEYCTIENTEFIMNGRCFSFKGPNDENYSIATSPGPTLKMLTGTQVNIVLENNFYGLQQEIDCHNLYCGMDIINLHTHGLHISSFEDDVINVHIKPRINGDTEFDSNENSYTYTYTIPEDHYPGIHWYHPHNHGSVSSQIHFGLFGAIIIEYDNSDKYIETNSQQLYTDGNIDEIYKTNILIFSSVYAVNTELCTCSQDILNVGILEEGTNNAREGIAAYGRCVEHGKNCFHQYSACYEYCAFETSRDQSGLEYNIQIKANYIFDNDGIDQFALVNGIYNPTIEITQNKYRRLQFVNTMHQYYIHYKFPDINQCQILLLGYDGIFFESPRDLNIYSNELILSSGSRGDILIKCSSLSEYQVLAIALDGQTSLDDEDFDDLERFGSDQDNTDEQKKLFIISVISDAGDVIDNAPENFPNKPNYLKDLQNVDDSEIDSNCACNQYRGEGEDKCYIHYSSKDGVMAVNGEEFIDSDRYLTYMIKDRIYQFTLRTDRHVHHQHVYPFQVMENIASNGFIARAGDFFDTMGAEHERNIRIYTADFSGYMMLHCHILPHEDEGMMALMYVIDDILPLNAPSPISSPTDNCLSTLYDGGVLSPTPEPTIINSGSNKPSKQKRSNSLPSLLFHFKFNINTIMIIFMLLTLCNTFMICQSKRKTSKMINNKIYGVVIEDEDI